MELETIKNNYIKETILKDLTQELESKITDIDFSFNPDTRSISEIYKIMDDIQMLQTQFANLKTKALKEELLIELCYNEIKNRYDNRYDEILLEIKDDEKLGNIKEKESYVKNKIRSEQIYNYLQFFENKKIKIKNILKRIETIIENLDKIDSKVSRKITLMQIQKDLGTLIDIRLK